MSDQEETSRSAGVQIEPHSPLARDIRLLFHQLATMQREWQDEIGFGEEGTRLRSNVVAAYIDPERTNASIAAAEGALRNYYIAKLALIDTEVAEAIEEIRANRKIDETYLRHAPGCAATEGVVYEGARVAGECNCTPKPEGVLSEIADVLIRVFSLAGEANLPLADMVIAKLNYNATRAQRHGGKAI